MFIPIVRRTVTVRVREQFDFPFQCATCRLSTCAHAFAEGIGSATMAYVAPDENAARHRARTSAYQIAASTVASSPCPRCGGHPASLLQSIQAWEAKKLSRKQAQFWTLIASAAVALVGATGCVGMVAASDDGTASSAVMLSFYWIAFCVAAGAILFAVLGPGARPRALGYVPQNVWFDPPDASQVIGTYRWVT